VGEQRARLRGFKWGECINQVNYRQKIGRRTGGGRVLRWQKKKLGVVHDLKKFMGIGRCPKTNICGLMR